MKNCLLVALITLVLPFYGKAQFIMPNEKDAKEFKKRALIVQLRTPDEGILKKYRKEPETLNGIKSTLKM